MAGFRQFSLPQRYGTDNEAETAENFFPKELTVASVSQSPLPRFASLSDATMGVPESRSLLARFFRAPFADIDDRVARLLAASRAERAMREAAAMSDEAEPRRS
jgi:hypothetical protein